MNNPSTSFRAWLVVVAAGILSLSSVANADSGLYAGGSVGGATLEAEFDTGAFPELPSSLDEDDTAFKLFVGYKLDLPVLTLGVEAGYVDLGAPEIPVTGIPGLNEFDLETTGINLWGTAGIEAGPLDIYGKLGYISWDTEVSAAGFGSIGDDGSDPAYGLGVSFGLSSLEVRGEYEIYDFEGADVKMLSVGISFYF